jgi:hypothetical protein
MLPGPDTADLEGVSSSGARASRTGCEADHAEPEPAELEEVAAAAISGASLRRMPLLLGRCDSQDTARELALS